MSRVDFDESACQLAQLIGMLLFQQSRLPNLLIPAIDHLERGEGLGQEVGARPR
jgi:hypothetical protein